MGFRCIDCGKDFGNDKQALIEHRKEHKPLLDPDKIFPEFNTMVSTIVQDKVPKSKRKKFVDLDALDIAIQDGRIEVWQDGNGWIHIRNKRSKKEIEVWPIYDMSYSE